MTRKEVYGEIKETLGLVPTFLKMIPDSTLELEWKLFKKISMEESAIPAKYRELIGLGLSAVTKCKYCTLFHTEMAKFFGATQEEIEDAVHFAKNSAGWSTYVNGLQIDYEQFKNELQQSIEYVKSQQKVHV
jgi:AhpD family alkylhydroperoxidase